MSFVLAGNGAAQISFGNVAVSGTVTLTVGGVTLGTAAGGDTTTIAFTYTNGQVLELSEDTATIGLASPAIVCGADVCTTTVNAAANDFTSVVAMSRGGWDTTGVYVVLR